MINLKLSQKINKIYTNKQKINKNQTNNNTYSSHQINYSQSIESINNRLRQKMGILQSCQGADSRMSISLDSNLFRQQSISRYSHDDFYFQHSKLQLFGDIFYKKLLGVNKSQFVLQTNHINRNSQVINLALRIYQDSNQFILQKGNKIKIINCIQDPNNMLQSLVYVIKLTDKPHQLLLKTIPFNKFQQEKFKRGLYEATMLQKLLTQENNRFIYGYRDAFVIQSGIDKDHNDKCLVLVGDYCSASLGEMITFRKLSNLSWTQNRFQTLCSQLIKGLIELHKQGIAHRDIRPGNIFYSQPKKSYLIGGLTNAILINQKNRNTTNLGYNLTGVPYYLPRYLVQIGKKQNYSEYYNYDPFKNDIYALGVTLLNALFLDTFTPVEILLASLKKYQTKYSYLNILKQMVSQNPPSLQFMLKTLPDTLSSVIDQKSNIQSLRYKLQPQDSQFVTKKKTIANGYYQLFMYDEWVEQINQVVNYYQLNQNSIELAQLYRKIAEIYAEHHQQEMMMEYFSKASHVYLLIASDCLNQKKTSEAIKYLEKGIDCNRKGFKGQPNTDLSNLLNKLAMAHHLKAQYQIARAFQQEAVEITAKVHGQKSLQFAEMLIDSARIESDFQQFKQAQNMLKLAKQVTEKLNESSQTLRVKARVLESLGTNYRMKAIERREKCDIYRNKAEQNLLDALKIIEQLEGSIHPQVGSILMALGNVYFDKRQFTQAKKSYERSLIVKQHTLKGRFNVQVGQCLTYLANSQKCLKQYEKAIKHYDEAIEVFRKSYGNDHNENTAVAIGNLGLVYKQLGRKSEQRQYLSLAKSILKDLFGEDCPDYQYFDRQMSRG